MGNTAPAAVASQASPIDRLVAACQHGDFVAAKAAIDAGATDNAPGTPPGSREGTLPLALAAFNNHSALIRLLLYHGADPNGDNVMYECSYFGLPDTLLLLVAAGGDVNRESGGAPPLFNIIETNHGGGEEKLRQVLAEPSLDLTATFKGLTPEQYAREWEKPALADAVAVEVGGRCSLSMLCWIAVPRTRVDVALGSRLSLRVSLGAFRKGGEPCW